MWLRKACCRAAHGPQRTWQRLCQSHHQRAPPEWQRHGAQRTRKQRRLLLGMKLRVALAA